MKIAILGFGREGKAVLDFLRQSPQYRKAEIVICDCNAKLRMPANTNIKSNLGKNYLKNLNKFDIVFRSPGVPYNLKEIQQALGKGVKFSSATKLFFDNFKGTMIGITGTKGKGTTATLLYKILKACGKNAYLAGNIGKPMLDLLSSARKNALAIIEVSSFQLQDLHKSPPIAVVLDIFPDHLDSHKNFREYLDAKSSIVKFQNKNDKAFYFADNSYSKKITEKSRGKKIAVSKKNSLFKPQDLKMPGAHNFKNAVMAATVAQFLGCSENKITKVIKSFSGNEHRLEFVRNIKRIKFYNDSASTNPQTAATAIKSFKETKILIAGGKDKNLDYYPLAKNLKNSKTKLVILYGENKKEIYREIRNKKLEIRIVKDLKTAISLAYQTAKQLQQLQPYNNITVIFSPASTSFDMFRDYAERGEIFKKIVKQLK